MRIKLTENAEQAFTSNGSECRKIKGITGDGREVTKTIFDRLQDKWPLLTANTELDLTMEKKGQFWNVVDINVVEGERVPVEQVIAESTAAQREDDKQIQINRAMCVKEIGEMYRAGMIQDGHPWVTYYNKYIAKYTCPTA